MFIIIDCYLVLHHKYEINVMLCYVMTTQTPSVTNCVVAIVHIKPVDSNISPKNGCHGNDP